MFGMHTDLNSAAPQRAEEELCNMLLEILLCVMWRGVEGSDDAAWLERGQVFSALTKLGTANELLLAVDQIKLRLENHVIYTLDDGAGLDQTVKVK